MPINRSAPLLGRRIAVPESRQLDLLAEMFRKRGAEVLRCPLVAIYDSPDTAGVNAWLEQFIGKPPDDLILLTGEGLRRLLGFARRHGIYDPFIDSLQQTCLICRGPKPGQALKQISLKPDIVAEVPTTEGVIATLERMQLDGCRIGVQLYGENPNTRLIEYLAKRKAEVSAVAPYRYAPDSEEQQVTALIAELASGSIDAVAFTSQPQLRRLLEVAEKQGRKAQLLESMSRIKVAAVGPVVAGALENAGLPVHVMPAENYFMKPMVVKLTELLSEDHS